MKINRQKKAAKNLSFYINNFKFRQPYQLLIDGTFCFAALNNKINISDNLPKYLQSELKLLTTQCVYLEMEKLGHKVQGALQILKQFAVHKCGHEGKPVASVSCMQSMIGKNNKSHYMVATQDRDLQQKLRLIPGVPMFYLHQKTPVFEHPSQASLDAVRNADHIGEYQRKTIEQLKIEHNVKKEEVVSKKRKKRKQPNPLSCLKKKKKVNVDVPIAVGKIEKVRRKKIRIPKHVKEELANKQKELIA